MITQRDGREMALKFLFCQEFLDEMSQQAPLENRFAQFKASFKAQPDVWTHAKNIITAFSVNHEKIDEKINGSLEKWSLERLSLTDKSILRIALSEALYMDTPPKVALNEAIDLGKKYSTADSSSFINGILDNIIQKEA